MYCDTDVEGRHTGRDMGEALKTDGNGFYFLKWIQFRTIIDEPGTLTAPLGFWDLKIFTIVHKCTKRLLTSDMTAGRHMRQQQQHTRLLYQITEKAWICWRNISRVRDVIGYDIPSNRSYWPYWC